MQHMVLFCTNLIPYQERKCFESDSKDNSRRVLSFKNNSYRANDNISSGQNLDLANIAMKNFEGIFFQNSVQHTISNSFISIFCKRLSENHSWNTISALECLFAAFNKFIAVAITVTDFSNIVPTTSSSTFQGTIVKNHIFTLYVR